MVECTSLNANCISLECKLPLYFSRTTQSTTLLTAEVNAIPRQLSLQHKLPLASFCNDTILDKIISSAWCPCLIIHDMSLPSITLHAAGACITKIVIRPLSPSFLYIWIRYTSSNVWVKHVVWNFKGYLWNSIQNLLPIHWKIWLLFNTEIFKSRVSIDSCMYPHKFDKLLHSTYKK